MHYLNETESILKKETWEKVNKNLLAKMLAEYMYEDMIHPEEKEEGFVFTVNEDRQYHFSAEKRLFESYDVDPESIKVLEDGEWKPAVNAIRFLIDIQPIIGMSAETAGHLIKELNHTLIADANLLSHHKKTSNELVDLDYAELEGEMSGHPWITYNKGRIGFGFDDYSKYAPENQNETKLFWIAVHRDRAQFQSVSELHYEKLILKELDSTIVQRFNEILRENGKLPLDYYFMPVHEWQWKNVLIQNFPEDLADGMIIPLEEGTDHYLPQQSIRTFVNTTNKLKAHVKLPMSILNTLVYRGLPSERTVIAPQVTEHIKGIFKRDSFLKEECEVVLPGEVASINVDHAHYSELKGAPYQYLEMLGTIWRESIYTYLKPGEQPITLAALHHVDVNGKPYVQSLIEKSGLSADEWVKKFFGVVMPPLLHFLYQYGTVFSPHGQNTILILKDYQPARLAVKDYVDDVNISDQPFPELEGITEDLRKVLRSEPPEGLTQFIFTGLFICHLRYMSNVLVRNELIEETAFWSYLVDSIEAYQERFSHLEERFKLFDFFKPELTKLCLNRNRMVDYGYGDGDDRPHASEFGKVKNALNEIRAKRVTV
ncbi:IucA/IucC family protein [Fictibacillus phosphorivorans]|uniref:IucA/IucC family protein n=1 Tax=Fictibacillus phosphorivorans TaxID=1221500 RepID=UPI00203F7AC9|nr:IucA/IucC family siderophore biosynthesis protein [Fictibacillus phosphorivorans]MCM3720021.1 IucA/IucC family siderophore biosynthesis protein [Fictibacillus phosphorivorans]MCM3777709.1 IucA/IucC family siderophore biosynthesis protein [Fictibacillus phosphorivorans]